MVTTKGKGYRPAERNPVLWHGASPFDAATGNLLKTYHNPLPAKEFGSAVAIDGNFLIGPEYRVRPP